MDALAFAASEGLAPVGDEAQPSLDRLLLLLLKHVAGLSFLATSIHSSELITKRKAHG
jgi:hypothetical protein